MAPAYSDGIAFEEEDEEPLGHVSVPWVVAAALLMGVGIFLLMNWLFTFQWVFLSGALLMLAGFLMCTSPRAGLDRAE
jgi:hypothetical protein